MAEKSASFRKGIHALPVIGPISESAMDGKYLSGSHRVRWTINERCDDQHLLEDIVFTILIVLEGLREQGLQCLVVEPVRASLIRTQILYSA